MPHRCRRWGHRSKRGKFLPNACARPQSSIAMRCAAARWIANLAACWSSERKRVERRYTHLSGRVTTEAIARSAHRFDQPIVAGRCERLAQPADVDVHGALLDEDMGAPDFVEQLSAAIHALNVGHEEMQHAELDVPELDIVAAAAHPVHDRFEP